MSGITANAFLEACKLLSNVWQHCAGHGGTQSDWRRLEVKPDGLNSGYLRITREVPLSLSASRDAGHEEEFTEDDPEALSTNKKAPELVQYDLVYSPSYQVPVVYVSFHRAGPLTLEALYDILVPEIHGSPLRAAGDRSLFGGLSLTDHPVTGGPVYFVHPCRTVEVMAQFESENRASGTDWLLRFIGLIGASVGLNVPVLVAQMLEECAAGG